MIDKKNVIIGTLIAALIYDGFVSRKNKKLFARKNARIDRLEDLVNFYARKLNDYEVPMNEFDRIVMHTYHEEL